jgi:hypothetical protein
VSGDRLVAAIFLLNTVGCGAVALLTVAKRLNARHGSRAARRHWFRVRSTGQNFSKAA